ncbi:hypothetical protein [Deinococcus sp. ME38]|uniref:hypothetical protein n=1 Tax=Deinococcus sp. ME38 TaxID=3400344 RepID=UPI003B5C57E1
MYPKLRNDVYLTPLGTNGLTVAIDGAAHRIQGRHLFTLLERLTPLLNGQHPLSGITARLDRTSAQVVQGLIDQLHRIGAVRDDTENRAVPVDPLALQHYPASLGYLERFTPHARQALNHVLTRPVRIVGGGSVVRTLAPALWESGVRHGEVILPAGDPLRAELLAQLRGAADPALNWQVTDQAQGTPPALTIVTGTPQEVRAALRSPDLTGGRTLPVVVSADFCTVGPVTDGDLRTLEGLPFTPPGPDTWSAYSVTGARTAIEVFRLLADLPSVVSEQLLRIDNHTLADTTHDVHGARAASLVDPFSGALASLDEEDLPQLPLYLVRARRRCSPDVGVGVGAAPGDARAAALLGTLAGTLPDRPDRPGRWVRAWGRTETEFRRMAALLNAEQRLAGDGAAFTPVDAPDLLGPEGAHWWKTLTDRYRQPLDAQVGAAGPLVVARLGSPSGHVTAAGFTAQDALGRALTLRLGQTQGQLDTAPYPPLPGDTGRDGLPGPLHLAPAYAHLTAEQVWVGWVGLS